MMLIKQQHQGILPCLLWRWAGGPAGSCSMKIKGFQEKRSWLLPLGSQDFLALAPGRSPELFTASHFPFSRVEMSLRELCDIFLS